MKAEEKVKLLKRWTQTKERLIIRNLENERFLEVISPNDFPEKLHWKQMMNSQIDQIIEYTRERFKKVKIT